MTLYQFSLHVRLGILVISIASQPDNYWWEPLKIRVVAKLGMIDVSPAAGGGKRALPASYATSLLRDAGLKRAAFSAALFTSSCAPAYFPVNLGFRFSEKAVKASKRSSEGTMLALIEATYLRPSSTVLPIP